MKDLDYSILAPLIRGLCINAVDAPRVVIPGPEGKEAELPAPALTIDLGSAWSDKTGLDANLAAKAMQEAYDAWEFEMAPAGVEAVSQKPTVNKQPSCIGIKIDGEVRAVYWIDRDIDAARKRMEKKNTALLEEKLPPSTGLNGPGASALHRSEVVRNRIALVTGGAQGFGEEIVRFLTASGALVFIADLNIDGAKKLADRINTGEKRTAAIAVPVNVADEASVKTMFETVAAVAGGLDLCISNAGVLRAGSVLEQDLESFRFVTDIDYIGFFLITKYAGRLLERQHRTAPTWKTDIIQINSKSGLEGSNKNGAYAGAKFGGIGLTASFALELVEYNIKVNAICPGNFLDGPLWSDPEKGLFVQYLKAGKVPGARNVADVKAFYESKVPMKRGCTGLDVIRAIFYLVEQEYETGQAVPVTGGQIMLH